MKSTDILLVNCTSADLDMFETAIRNAVIAGTSLPEEIADIFSLQVVDVPWTTRESSGTHKAIVGWATILPTTNEIDAARASLIAAGFTDAEIETVTGMGLRRLANCPAEASILVKVAAGALSLTGARRALRLIDPRSA